MGAAALTKLNKCSWAQICEDCDGEWVLLTDVDMAADGSIGAAHVAGHARSMRTLLTGIGEPQSNTIVVHTSGRPIVLPRIELTDEIRDIIRARR